MFPISFENGKIRFKLGLSRLPGLKEALERVLAARLGLCFFILSILTLQQVFFKEMADPRLLLTGHSVLAVCFFVSFFQAIFLEYLPQNWWIGAANIAFDTVAISTLIFLWGSDGHLLALLYLVQILFVSLIYLGRGALLSASMAVLCFALVCWFLGDPNGLLIWGAYSGLFLILGSIGGFLSGELRHASERLREESSKMEGLRKLHEKIVLSMPTGLLTVDEDMRVRFVNPAGEHILAKRADEIIGLYLGEVESGFLPFFTQIDMNDVSEGDGEPGIGDGETTLSVTGPVSHRSFFVHPKDNTGTRIQQVVEIDSGTKKKVIRGDAANLSGGILAMSPLGNEKVSQLRVLLFQDVTKLSQLEEKLKQHEKLAAVGQLAAGIAHEIRNPLASMSASIEMLQQTLASKKCTKEDQKLMDITLREIERLNNLITEFLDYVRPSKIKLERVSLKEILSDLVASVQKTKVYSAKVRFREVYDQQSFALANSEKLKQVVWNLLVNAVEAMDNNGFVEVGCSKVNGRVVKFWVQDEGAGIGEKVMEHLYEPFFTTKDKGTGLGLATAYKIVEAHHGEIRVSTKVKEGTKFEIYLQSA